MSETLSLTTPTDRELVITRTFNAPRTLLFEAYTNPQHILNWMPAPEDWTMPICHIDLRPGSTWHFLWRNTNGVEIEKYGICREIAPPELLVTTESQGIHQPETLNTKIFSEHNDKTTLTVNILYATRQLRDANLSTNIRQDIFQRYNRLAIYLLVLSKKQLP